MHTRTTALICATALLLCGTIAGCGAAAPDGTLGQLSPNYGPAEATSDQEWLEPPPDWPEDQEAYDRLEESPFKDVSTSPLSTFSADVDTASYSNLRRQLNAGVPPQGVRIEEMVNYFDYDYPAPDLSAEHPFDVTTVVAECPWNPAHQLALIGVQATRAKPTSEGNNIVFLIDTSGSMADDNKLPLLIESFALLVEQLDYQDVVSIVTYAGSERVVADSVPGSEHGQLLEMLRSLQAGGSTAGAAGLTTAYDLARKNFIRGGNNRVILATDGDFNVGLSTPAQLTDLIERERASGTYISVLGFGMYNLKDNTMEAIAHHGNGNYAYIDTLEEARKVLVDEFDATMFVVAQDLKLQVEFNPTTVQQYRLIGYDGRRLENEDFADDAKDAGDVGAGHAVSAFYELIPANGEPGSGNLKYQATQPGSSTDYFTVAVRYKQPGAATSTEVLFPVGADTHQASPSTDFAFAAAVAEFGLILTDSHYRAEASLTNVLQRANEALGQDYYGLRQEFVELVGQYAQLG